MINRETSTKGSKLKLTPLYILDIMGSWYFLLVYVVILGLDSHPDYCLGLICTDRNYKVYYKFLYAFRISFLYRVKHQESAIEQYVCHVLDKYEHFLCNAKG